MTEPTLRIDNALRSTNNRVTNGDLDLNKPDHNGMAFDLAAIANSTPYTKNPLYIQLTRAPKAFKLHPDGEYLTAALKRLIERHPKNWTGFQQVLQIETMQIPKGWDRQMLTIPTNVTRGPITPTLTADKLYDEVDARFWNYFIETFLSNPTTQRPNYAELTSVPEDWLVDQFTFDILAWEPDMTYTRAIKAWACAAMLPTNSVDVTGERDTQNAHVNEEYSIAFACVYDGDQTVVETASELMKAMNIHSVNPIYKARYFSTVASEVSAAGTGILDEYLEKGETWTK